MLAHKDCLIPIVNKRYLCVAHLAAKMCGTMRDLDTRNAEHTKNIGRIVGILPAAPCVDFERQWEIIQCITGETVQEHYMSWWQASQYWIPYFSLVICLISSGVSIQSSSSSFCKNNMIPKIYALRSMFLFPQFQNVTFQKKKENTFLKTVVYLFILVATP